MTDLARNLLLVPSLFIAAAAPGQGESVVDTPHNLSTGGPGPIRATSEEQICIFCHTPHNAAPIRPLWNRDMPLGAYLVYSSNALDAAPGQPTGNSKMCLSCHDGTIALGSVLSRDQVIQMAGGVTTIPPGASNLGTDLSDDHPISFRYDSSLVGRDPMLVDPLNLPSELTLDANRELQCTTCHDAHDNTLGSFLTMSNDNSAMCRSCHRISTTTVPPHVDCRSCHRTHSAPSGPYLLASDLITNTCVTCHDGSAPGAADILADLQQLFVHDTNSPVDPPDPMPGHVTCADCHDPHTMDLGSAQAPDVHPNFGRVKGVSAFGSDVDGASYEYEVCFKCHADENVFSSSWVPRRITQMNTRLEFDLAAVSFHPVEGPGRNPDVPSLRPPWTESSIVYCSDCHGSETSRKAGGSGPNGPHGSNEEPLLLARYETADFTSESEHAYSLCYRCHDRDGSNGILRDRSFEHKTHIKNANTPCSVCHDAHGISSLQGSTTHNSHLINFDATVVFPDPQTGRLEFTDTGVFRGTCTLLCHGVRHESRSYRGR